MRAPRGHFPDPLDLRLLPQRSRWLVVRHLWAVGGWSRLAAIFLCLTWWRKTRRRFRLLAEFRYVTSTGVTIFVLRGTVIDFASIPCVCWRVVGQPVGDYAEASVPHDALWAEVLKHVRKGRPVTFGFCNRVFLDGMATLGVSRWRRFAMWTAVSLNGRYQVWRHTRRRRRRRQGGRDGR